MKAEQFVPPWEKAGYFFWVKVMVWTRLLEFSHLTCRVAVLSFADLPELAFAVMLIVPFFFPLGVKEAIISSSSLVLVTTQSPEQEMLIFSVSP